MAAITPFVEALRREEEMVIQFYAFDMWYSPIAPARLIEMLARGEFIVTTMEASIAFDACWRD